MLRSKWGGWRHLTGKPCVTRDHENPIEGLLVGYGMASRLLLICSSLDRTSENWCYSLHVDCQGP